jgi:hypothetical protein
LFLSEVFLFNLSLKICLTVFLTILTVSTIILMLKHRSLQTISLIFLNIFFSFLIQMVSQMSVVFRFLLTFHKPFVSFKNMCAWCNITIHLLYQPEIFC